jgi:hypothetical protein
MNTDPLRIFHNPLPQFFGPNNSIPTVSAVLGVDNILAAAGPFQAPEPSGMALLAAALFGWLGWRGSRRDVRSSEGQELKHHSVPMSA